MTIRSLIKRIRSRFAPAAQQSQSLIMKDNDFTDAYIKIDQDGAKHVFLSGLTRYGKGHAPQETRKPQQIIEVTDPSKVDQRPKIDDLAK